MTQRFLKSMIPNKVIVLLGARRIGKTSFLKHLQTPSVSRESETPMGYRKGDYIGNSGPQVERLPQLDVGSGMIFYDVLAVTIPANAFPGYFYEMNYAENIGLVKYRQRSDNSEWMLIRYNIHQ